MAFKLDTSGVIGGDMWGAKPTLGTIWDDLSPFTQGYIEALFADHSVSRYRSDEDRTYSHGAFDMLALETLERICADCEAWRAEFVGKTANVSADRADMGREFWRIRQEGKRSTFPPLTVQLGDDGKVRFA